MHILASVLLVFISFTIDLTDEYRGIVKARSNGMGEMWTTQNHNVERKGSFNIGRRKKRYEKDLFLVQTWRYYWKLFSRNISGKSMANDKANITWNSKFVEFAQKHRVVKRTASSSMCNKTETACTSIALLYLYIQNMTSTKNSSKQNSKKLSKTKSCKKRCTNKTEWRVEERYFCFCDPDCYKVFKDCCSDYTATCGVQKPQNNSKFNWECVELGNYRSDNTKISHGVWMVTQCASDWPWDHNRQSCQEPTITTNSPDIHRIVPVLNRDNVTFRNVYCALCNNVTDTNDFWTFDIATEVIPPVDFNLTEQIRFYLAHGAEFRRFKPRSHQHRRYCYELEGGAKRPVSFSFVLNFRRFGGKEKVMELNKPECETGLIYDERLQVCTIKWLRPSIEAGRERYYVISWLKTTQKMENTLSKTIVQQALLAYFQLFPENLNVTKITPVKDLSFFIVKSNLILTPEQSLELWSPKSDKNNARASKIFNFIYFKNSWQLKILNRTFTVFKTTSRPLKCFGRKIYTPREYLMLDSEKVIIYSTNFTYEKTEYFMEKSANSSEFLGNITVCHKYIPISCNLWRVLSPQQFKILENLTIYENSTSSLHDYGQYEVLGNDSIQICMSSYKRYTGRSQMINKDQILGWITVVCFMLSIPSLVVLLITYSMFSELRKLPGKNLMNLATSLLMSAIFWLITSFTNPEQYPKLCTAMTIVQHYFLVASFASMSVISFHTCKTFARKMPAPKSSRNHERRLFIIYFALIWFLPAVFATTCFLLDANSIMSLGYG